MITMQRGDGDQGRETGMTSDTGLVLSCEATEWDIHPLAG